MTALEALSWADEVGAAEVADAPGLPDAAAGLLRRLDFPILPTAAGASPPAPAAGEAA